MRHPARWRRKSPGWSPLRAQVRTATSSPSAPMSPQSDRIMRPATALKTKLAAAQKQEGVVGGATTSIVVKRRPRPAGRDDRPRYPRLAGRRRLHRQRRTGDQMAGRQLQGGPLRIDPVHRPRPQGDRRLRRPARAHPKAPGKLMLFVDGKQAGSAIPFSEDASGPIVLTDLAEILEQPGQHLVELQMEGGSPDAVLVRGRFPRRTTAF